LLEYSTLFETIYKTDSEAENDAEENYPSSPSDVPLSKAGSLFLITSFIFSSLLFGSKKALPTITVFPDHEKLVKHFINTGNPEDIGNEAPGVLDAVLAIGLWLEHANKFVSGPLEDDEFLQQLQYLSLISANNPSPSLRYAAHLLTSSILHAHPVDRLRLTFIIDTLENCPYEPLKASAVAWLKDEIITAYERKSGNVFSTTVALSAAQPYLFLHLVSLSEASNDELIEKLAQSFPYDMAVVNFLYFIGAKEYAHIVPSGMFAVVEEIYLGPLRTAQENAIKALSSDELSIGRNLDDVKVELELLGDRIAMASKQIDAI
jgi:hypothetical protein